MHTLDSSGSLMGNVICSVISISSNSYLDTIVFQRVKDGRSLKVSGIFNLLLTYHY